MAKLYTSVPVPKFPSNTFSLSRPVLGTMTFHKLYPTDVKEVIPGDAFVEHAEVFARCEPMVAPAMAKVDLDQHEFFVPAWQLNNHFDDFITGGEKYDFTDHMPFAWVSDFYLVIDHLLDPGNLPDAWFTGVPHDSSTFDSNYRAQAVVELNYRMDLALRILENCDYLRAIPFVKPDLIFLLSNATVAGMWTTCLANKAAFENAQPANLSSSQLRVNLLPFGAETKTWCEFFRDENLCSDLWDWVNSQNSAFFNSDGCIFLDALDKVQWVDDLWQDLHTYMLSPSLDEATFGVRDQEYQDYEFIAIHRRAWRKDRFTSALPFTQKGPDVLVPLQGIFEVENSNTVSGSGHAVSFDGTDKSLRLPNNSVVSQSIDLSANRGQGTTIRELRRAYAAEDFAEADGRFGNRYPENTLGQFGVRTPDARLPRCNFLGSRTQTLVVSEVVQNSETGSTPQGNLAGKGSSYGASRLFRGYFTQHGFIVGFTSIRVSALYHQGIHPMFSRFDRTEYAWPRFARLGEEPIYMKELSLGSTQDPTGEDEVFGYAPRYSSYKSDTGSIHGLLKGSRDYWTFSREFASKPKLNEEFIYNPPRLDAFAVINPMEDQFTVQINYYCKSRRKLPYWGTPTI